MSAFLQWFAAHPERIIASWIIIGAATALLLGRMIADADHDVYGDDDEPTPADDVAHVHDLAAQLANDQAWARATWFPGGQR